MFLSISAARQERALSRIVLEERWESVQALTQQNMYGVLGGRKATNNIMVDRGYRASGENYILAVEIGFDVH